MKMEETLDLLIIGGGVNGLCALRTNLAANASAAIALVDCQHSLGGVWARERLYTGLKSNNVLGNYEFSDYPMDAKKFNLEPGQHIPGEVVNEYFEAFCEHFSLRKHIRLGRKVESVTRQDDQNLWVVEVIDVSDNSKSTIKTKKLIVATGLTSQPSMPTIIGKESFNRPLIHSADLKSQEPQLLQPGKRITVVGGAKSAFDAAYLFAETGSQPVDMIIRASGHGPAWISPAYVTPLKKLLEKLLNTRLLTWFSPCIWGDADGYSLIRRVLHSTWLGRKIVDAFWFIIGNDVKTLNSYDSHPETAKLKPWVDPLWVGSGLSILNYDHDLLEMVRNGRIKVHVADIEHVSEGAVHLSSGEVVPSDGIVCCTGWRTTPNIKFYPAGIETELGLPTAKDPIPKSMQEDADRFILSRLPRLRSQPLFNANYKPSTAETEVSHPIRLYRFMAPCSPNLALSRSIAFLGITTTASTTMVAQVQALWVVAYFEGTLSLPSEAEMQWSTALHTQFCKWRYGAGATGNRNPDFVFDAVPYMDLMLKDLGMKGHRKESRLKEWLEAYGVENYRGLVEEYLEKLKTDKKNT